MAVSLLRYLVITYLLARYVFIRPSSNRKISLVFSWLRLDPCVVTSLLPPWFMFASIPLFCLALPVFNGASDPVPHRYILRRSFQYSQVAVITWKQSWKHRYGIEKSNSILECIVMKPKVKHAMHHHYAPVMRQLYSENAVLQIQ